MWAQAAWARGGHSVAQAQQEGSEGMQVAELWPQCGGEVSCGYGMGLGGVGMGMEISMGWAK